MSARKRIALVAHASQKPAIVDCARQHRETLARHAFWGTCATAQHVADGAGHTIQRLMSGPLGGDQQLGTMITEGRLDILVSFIEPMAALPHDVGAKALARISTLHQTMEAFNAATADYVIRASLMNGPTADRDAS